MPPDPQTVEIVFPPHVGAAIGFLVIAAIIAILLAIVMLGERR